MSNTQGLICASLSGEHAAELIEQGERITSLVNLFEIRLDSMLRPEIELFCQRLDKPLLFTNRALWEGGLFTGDEIERVALLHQAIDLGCHYVDIELQCDEALRISLINHARKDAAKVIVSFHDFIATPPESELQNVLKKMQATGAYAGKIVTTANSPTDVVRVLNLLAQAKAMQFPLTAFCMGSAGKISRFATLFLGGFMTYVAPSAAKSVAPGQFAADHFHSLVQLYENNAH